MIRALEQALGEVSGVVMELHAGSAYLDYGWWLGSENVVQC
jgi:hypothetical protein